MNGAAALDTSVSTVQRDWVRARAWFAARRAGGAESGARDKPVCAPAVEHRLHRHHDRHMADRTARIVAQAAHRPATELARFLSSCKDSAGTVTIPDFYDDTLPMSEADRAAIERAIASREPFSANTIRATSSIRGSRWPHRPPTVRTTTA